MFNFVLIRSYARIGNFSISNCTFSFLSVTEQMQRSEEEKKRTQYFNERVDEQGVLEWSVLAVVQRVRLDEWSKSVRYLMIKTIIS